MEQTQERLIESQSLREELISRISILDKVGNLILLSNTDYATTKQVADYYEVATRSIEDIIYLHKDELISDGFGVRKAEDFISELNFGNKVIKQRGKFLVKISEDNILSFAPRGINLFPKRAILRIGMLLRDSLIAKEIRTQLLNIEEKAPTEMKIQEIDKEKKLVLDTIFANSDEERIMAMSNYKQYKDRHIEALQMENKALADGILTWSNRSVINKLVRRIAIIIFKGNYVKAWEKLWGEMYYKHHIWVSKRIKKCEKKNATTFDVLYPAEIIYALKSAISLCERYEINISDIMMEENIDMNTINDIEYIKYIDKTEYPEDEE